jgi:PKHD-type hydroxylase
VEIARAGKFVDGRISNPHSQVKKNLHHDQADPGYAAATKLLADALMRSEPFRLFAFPRRLASPTLTKHGEGMAYGVHCDVASMMVGQRPLRSDLSCTIFLADPAAYGGGELVIHLGTRPIPFKGAPGSCLIYPSTTLHEVRPVTSGERIVGITFIESQIADGARRELLYELNEVAALEGLKMSWSGRTRLSAVSSNLQRMWSEPA